MKIKLTWLLAFKAFITLFWCLGMVGFISIAIDDDKTFWELLTRWDIVLIFIVSLLGCLSVVLDFFFRDKRIMIDYFLSFFLLIVCFLFISIFMQYIRFLEYEVIFTSLLSLVLFKQTIHLSLWFVYFGFTLCGIISYFQKNYKRATLCFAFCFISFIPFVLKGQMVFDIK